MTSQTLFLVFFTSLISVLNSQTPDSDDLVHLDQINLLEFHHNRLTQGERNRLDEFKILNTPVCD